MSRFRLLAMFATMLALAAALAACGSGGGSDDPQQVIENATFEGVESGDVDLLLHIRSEGVESGNFKLRLSGPFQSVGGEDLPELDFSAAANGSVNGRAIKFQGGLALLGERAYIEYEGSEYEVDPTTLGFVKSSLEQAVQQGSSKDAGNLNACREAATGLQVGDFVENFKDEGSVDVEGASTTKVSGDLDVAGTIDALLGLTEDPACSAQLEAAGPLPLARLEAAKKRFSSSLKKTHADVYVGDDDIIRKIAAELTVSPKGSDETLEIEFELSLGGVNEAQEISAPAGARPLEELFQKLNINPVELLESASNGEIGNLLERIGSGSSGETQSAEEGGGGSSQKAFLECLQKAKTPVDLQNCASLKP